MTTAIAPRPTRTRPVQTDGVYATTSQGARSNALAATAARAVCEAMGLDPKDPNLCRRIDRIPADDRLRAAWSRWDEVAPALEAVEKIVQYHAHRLWSPYGGAAVEDLIQEATLGLMRQIGRYDQSVGSWTNYATRIVWQAVSRAQTVAGRSLGARLDGGDDQLAHDLLANVVDPRGEADDQGRAAVRSEWADRLTAAIAAIARRDPRRALILRHRYGLGGAVQKHLSELGRELGISKERVRQIQAKAEAELRAHLACYRETGDDQ